MHQAVCFRRTPRRRPKGRFARWPAANLKLQATRSCTHPRSTMARLTFVLVPGAGGDPWYWRLLAPRLEALGHEAIPVQLPGTYPLIERKASHHHSPRTAWWRPQWVRRSASASTCGIGLRDGYGWRGLARDREHPLRHCSRDLRSARPASALRQPELRGKGTGRRLMRAAVESAASRPEVQVLTLTLTEGNEPALHLYESMGSAVWGVEPLSHANAAT